MMNHSMFMPHGWCMTWNPMLIGLHVTTDALVALSYYSIPAALFVAEWKKQEAVPIRPLLILFGLFIAFCGAGHAIDIVSIWYPLYWLKGWWNLGTAATSVVTAFVLVPQVADFVRMPEATKRLRAEASALQEKQGLLRAVLDNVSEGIMLVGDHDEVLLANAAAERILGPGTRVDWLGHSDTAEEVVRRDGRIVEQFATRVPEYGRLYVLRDITERRASEETRLRLEQIVATMKQGFAILSMESRQIVATNLSFEKMHGYGPGELTGQPIEVLYAGTEEERSAVANAIEKAARRHNFWEGETRGRRKDGPDFIAFERVNLHNEEGRQFLSVTKLDITEQKRLEEEAANIQKRMLQTQKLESLGVLAGGVAHDFNNLLTGILGNASLAQEMLPVESPLQSPIRDVVRAGERAADLTRQLLAYSGKGRFIVEPINLSRLSEEISGLVLLSIPRTVQLRMVLPENLPAVEADAGQLQQLIMNLVINGAEAVGEAPGTVTLTTGTQTVTEADVRTIFAADNVKPGNFVFLEVQDTGSGMDEATRAQIFDPFFTTKLTGRGLGLAAALGIVRGHGGFLKVYSELGRGSTFRVLLPVLKGEEAASVRQLGSRALSGSGTILVVDDEELIRKMAKNTLEHYGYRVLSAENGAKAVDLFKAGDDKIDLVLLDMTMPVMSGEETLRRLKELRPGVAVLLSSGFNESEAVRRFAGRRLAGFVQKP